MIVIILWIAEYLNIDLLSSSFMCLNHFSVSLWKVPLSSQIIGKMLCFAVFLSTFVFTITFSRWFFTAEAHVKVIHHLAVVYVVEIILSIDLVVARQSLV